MANASSAESSGKVPPPPPFVNSRLALSTASIQRFISSCEDGRIKHTAGILGCWGYLRIGSEVENALGISDIPSI